jgi:hypothetical protein
MSQLRSKDNWTRADLAMGAAVVVVALLLLGLIFLRGKAAHSAGPQRCPIDGMAAEWRTEERGRTICNYGHFSKADQKAHTWWAACQ